jgi:hypothetical protein
MVEKPQVLAILSFLWIPAATGPGARPCDSINPEIAAHPANHERNDRRLRHAKSPCLLAVVVVSFLNSGSGNTVS